MCKVQDVADFFVDSALSDPEDNMTNMRVNKLLFFAQGWSLARRQGKPLFQEDFYAWDFGPVVPAVYHKYKIAGRGKIQDVDNDNYDEHFSEEETQLLIDVLREYSGISTSGLVSMSHKNGSPWDNVYECGKNNLIPKEDIRAYFESLPALPSFAVPSLSDKDFIGHRDAVTGNYVVPGDWFDD